MLRKRVIQCIALYLLLTFSVAGYAQSSNYISGKTYDGRNKYIQYIAGNLPIIIAAPHGGTQKPGEIPNRTYGVTGGPDSNSKQYAQEVTAYMAKIACGRPHLIINNLHRSKLDANRNIKEAAQGSQHAETAWREFHAFIEAAKEKTVDKYGYGHFFDFHTNAHKQKWTEMGMLLRASDLSKPDSTLNQAPYRNKSSIKRLAGISPESFSQIVRGPNSLGNLLQKRGYKTIPSLKHPNTGGGGYFSGGYNTWRHGSKNGGVIDGTQVESYYSFIRKENRPAYVKALTHAILDFFEVHYGVSFRKENCGDTVPPPPDSAPEPAPPAPEPELPSPPPAPEYPSVDAGFNTGSDNPWTLYYKPSGSGNAPALLTLANSDTGIENIPTVALKGTGNPVYLGQHGIPLTSNTDYRLTLRLKGINVDPVQVHIHKGSFDGHHIVLSNFHLPIAANSIWQPHEILFTSPKTTDNAWLGFELNNAQTGQFYLSDLVLEEVITEEAPAEPEQETIPEEEPEEESRKETEHHHHDDLNARQQEWRQCKANCMKLRGHKKIACIRTCIENR